MVDVSAYEIHDDFYAELMSFSEKFLEIFVGAENFVDFREVGYVVAVIDLG
jgi:hypothetical protein